ncbi:EAL domain-containing protein [Acidovorax sp. sic0104]|uniref:EAL domain-containing protein n=1 Tax=Acidovorax sp. sic0104 TaxID=2854784 RepID=UPI001C44F9AA|nr:EAL domain-containing protein [Acidovorax sp. sic0104]MBV7542097.1 EAL domain-containing protein [Acidovorax sp. sic0104]
MSEHFRAQPIVKAHSDHRFVGLELLHRSTLQYQDPQAMLDVDIRAVENAAILAREYGYQKRIHCNVEISSLVHTKWIDAMAGSMCPGVVVELVERNHLLNDDRVLHKVHLMVDAIRKFGGIIALDDVTGTPIEMDAIKTMRPEIIKVEREGRIDRLKAHTKSTLVVERIESLIQASQAKELGVDELQGYWCDVRAASEIPAALTPPGIAFFASQEALRRAA